MADALALEHQSLCFNPRGTLYRDRTLYSIVAQDGNTGALTDFEQALKLSEHALYRVRRIYKAPGQADRAVEKLATGMRAEMLARFADVATSLTVHIAHGISYGYVRERQPNQYPSTEEFYVVAPATVESKTRHGFKWFEERWAIAVGATGQGDLFD